MRHIPEEELHAYLDQALSRSQCVEIERHLARCPRCRTGREQIAAVRDRTTDLLALLGPTPFLAPSFDHLRTRLQLRRRRRRKIAVAAAAIAMVALVREAPLNVPVAPRVAPAPVSQPVAISVANGDAVAPAPSPAPSPAPAPPPASTRIAAPTRRADSRPAPSIVTPVTHQPAEPATHATPEKLAVPEAPLTAVSFEDPRGFPDPSGAAVGSFSEIETRPVDPLPTPPGLWLTVGTDNLGVAVPAGAARIPGLPVVQVRIQPGLAGADVVAVDRLLDDGDVVRTISGPPERVHTALAGDGEFHDPNDSHLTVTIRQADRMVAVTGPSGVLGTLLSASGLRRRY